MVVDVNTNNSLYAEFKDSHPSWSLIACALTFGSIGTIGIVFNFSVILVTFRSKSLKGTANFLLALCSFFELLHQQGHFLFMFTALSGQNFIEYKSAAMILALSMFGLGGIGTSMFFTGFDRLFCVLFDKIHSKMNLKIYLGAITFVCCLFGFALVYMVYLTVEQLNGLLITGCIVDIFQGLVRDFFAPTNMYTNIVTSGIYLILGVSIKAKTAFSTAHSEVFAATNRRLLRALFAIISVNIGGYLISCAYVMFFMPSITSPITEWFWRLITGIPLNVSAASNAPILYFTSIEYRLAFRSVFPSLFKPFQQKINKQAQTNIVHLKTFTVNAGKIYPCPAEN